MKKTLALFLLLLSALAPAVLMAPTQQDSVESDLSEAERDMLLTERGMGQQARAEQNVFTLRLRNAWALAQALSDLTRYDSPKNRLLSHSRVQQDAPRGGKVEPGGGAGGIPDPPRDLPILSDATARHVGVVTDDRHGNGRLVVEVGHRDEEEIAEIQFLRKIAQGILKKIRG